MKHLIIHNEDWVISRDRGDKFECVNKLGEVRFFNKTDPACQLSRIIDNSDIIIPNLPLLPDRPSTFLSILRQARLDYISKKRFDKFNKKRKPRVVKEGASTRVKTPRKPRSLSGTPRGQGITAAKKAAESQLESLFSQLGGTNAELAATLKLALAGADAATAVRKPRQTRSKKG